MRKRKLKRNLGVSTVVANMMMISITLALAAILVAWAGTSYGSFSSGSQLFFLQRGQAMQERFVVETVFFDKDNNFVRVFVRNVGVEEVRIVAFYVNGTTLTPTGSGSTCIFDTSINPPSTTLTIGQVCEFRLNWTTWTHGTPPVGGLIFYIVVATVRGNQATYVARGP